ncbi:MAG TPA: OB-fold nucleic acid binding domain-containing protein, partial [Beutenbergiaceae bacterium]|nr:OB-fold nucleic acid binding domain-containing protein [Beutenbergiaceae bacterium]
DMTGGIEVLFFGDTYLAYSTVLANDAVVVIKGRVRTRDDGITLQALEVSVPDISAGSDQPLTVVMASTRCVAPVVERLRGILTTHPGVSQVHLKLTAEGKATLMRLDDGLRVERSPALYGELKALLGPNCLV